MMDSSALGQEWQVLQQQHEQIEKSALWIKLAAVALCFVSLAVVVDLLLAGVLIAILWLQEAIVRTSQARIGARLLEIERLQAQDVAQAPLAFQLHTTWQARRGTSLGLLTEYLANAARPTVAFPYAVLLLVLIAALSVPAA